MTVETNALNVQVQRRVRRERNARLIRGVLVTLLITVAMVLLAISNRDQQAFKESRKSMERIAAAFVQQFEQSVAHPVVELPTPKCIGNTGFKELAAERGLAGVCARPVDMFFWSDGWHVVTYQAGKFNVVWMDWRKFRKIGPVLGLISE